MSSDRSRCWPSIICLAGLLWSVAYSLPARATPEQVQKLIADGRLDQALVMTNKELAADRNNVSYRFLKGLILTRQEKLEQARDIFIDITRTNPELPEPYNNLAVIHAALGDFDAARQALEQAINTHPAYATAYENIGDIYAKLASQAYNQALELDRDNNTARAKLSLVDDLFSLPQAAPVATPAPALATRDDSRNVPAPPVTTPVPVREVTSPPVQQTRAGTSDPGTRESGALSGPPVAAPVQLAPTVTAVAAPVQAAPTGQNPVAIIKQTVIDWSSAWSAQNVNTYLDFYAADFVPQDGRPIAQWRELRRQRLAQPGTIRVAIADLVVEMTGTTTATATFTQSYQSDSYSDRVKKTLLLKLVNNRWLITREQA